MKHTARLKLLDRQYLLLIRGTGDRSRPRHGSRAANR
jgi:hypothetical protein